MLRCKIKSVRSLGKQKTYNATMKSDQHNYAIYDEKTGSSVVLVNSHAAAYAFLAYQTVWLKRYYPIEFMCNLLSGEIGNEDKLRMYLAQANRMGILMKPEDINQSGLEFKIQTGTNQHNEKVDILRKPLTGLKGVGAKAVKNIVDNQPYKDLSDFLSKIDSRIVNVRVFATLAQSGCMQQAWSVSPKHLMSQYENAKKKIDKKRKVKKKQDESMQKFGGKSLFDSGYSGSNITI